MLLNHTQKTLLWNPEDKNSWKLGTNSGYQEKFVLRQCGEALAQAAQGGGGVTVPGGVQELWRCGTEERGQWAWWDGLELDFGILEVFSNLNDSMIL